MLLIYIILCSFQLRLDAEELRKLLATAERQRVKDTLTIELRKVETEITRLEEEIKKSGENTANEPAVPLAKPTQSRIPTVDIKNYGIKVALHSVNNSLQRICCWQFPY